MPKPGEHKTVQARILRYAEAIGWTFVPREEAEQRRGFDPEASPKDRAKGASLFFDDLLDAKVRAFNPRYAEADAGRTRGLVWHTQGSGKTFTMIKAAEMLFKAPQADKPTVLLMIDRNELEDQMLKNLAALGLGNLEHASSIRRLNKLLRDDYRGIIVTMIHKFRDMPANLNTRANSMC